MYFVPPPIAAVTDIFSHATGRNCNATARYCCKASTFGHVDHARKPVSLLLWLGLCLPTVAIVAMMITKQYLLLIAMREPLIHGRLIQPYSFTQSYGNMWAACLEAMLLCGSLSSPGTREERASIDSHDELPSNGHFVFQIFLPEAESPEHFPLIPRFCKSWCLLFHIHHDKYADRS